MSLDWKQNVILYFSYDDMLSKILMCPVKRRLCSAMLRCVVL
jgi:hypothetical protein